VVKRVLQQREPALVESKGKPTVVILPADDYAKLVADRDVETNRQQQLALLEEAERFAQKVAARYPDQPLPDTVDIIQDMRAERDDDFLGLC